MLLQCLYYGKFFILLNTDYTVEMTRHCLTPKNVSPIKQWPNVVRIPSTKFQESLLNDWNEAAVDHVVDQHETPVLYLNGGSPMREKYTRCSDLVDSNPHHEENDVNKDNSVREIKDSQAPPDAVQRSEKDTCVLFLMDVWWM